MGEPARLDLGQLVSEPAVKPRLKVSREGVVLIKSLEGFRAWATPGPDGGWMIGYGHTLSAREGAVVGEGDAELLLQYDLLPVVNALNAHVAAPLNQHQIDALASFAFSVGVDEFVSSDVLERLNAGGSTDAADAMGHWPVRDGAAPPALRRRAAERALFLADPASPVALVDLLTAALPVQADPEIAEQPQSPAAQPAPAAPIAAEPAAEPAPAIARAQAVATLLGEVADLSDDAPVQTIDHPPVVSFQPAADASVAAAAPSPTSPAETTHVETRAAQPAAKPSAAEEARLAMLRYSPYAAPIFGPLPGLPPMPPRENAPAPAPAAAPVVGATSQAVAPLPPEPPAEPALASPDAAPPPFVVQPASQPVDSGPLLVLTPLRESDILPAQRPVWPHEDRTGAGEDKGSALFDEDIDLAQSYGSAISQEATEADKPRRFAWGETGAFIAMGGVGLVSFAAALAAFQRTAADGGALGDTAMIGGFLAFSGSVCVGLSAYNLYRRWGRAPKD